MRFVAMLLALIPLLWIWRAHGSELGTGLGSVHMDVDLAMQRSDSPGDGARLLCHSAGCSYDETLARVASSESSTFSIPEAQSWCRDEMDGGEECHMLHEAGSSPPPDSQRSAESHQSGNISKAALALKPSHIDWSESPVCSMKLRTVQLTNLHASEPLHITGLSSDNIQFYSLDPLQTEIPPKGSINITVAYLPQNVGMATGNILIQTSNGSAILKMSGQGVHSPYGVMPLHGPKVPVGLRYTYLLSVRNPHPRQLVIHDIYSKDDFLKLKVPNEPAAGSLERDGFQSFWVLKPFEEKAVIALEFESHDPRQYSGLIRLVTDDGDLFVPVDIVSVKGGVHAGLEEVDFGTLTYPEEYHRIPISLLNIGPGQVEVMDVTSTSDPLLGIQFKQGLVLDVGTERSVAAVSYVGAAQGRFSGKIYIVTNATSEVGNAMTHRIEVPYKARVLHGSLRYKAENSTFEAKKGRSIVRDLALTNYFPLPVVMYSATIMDPSFQVEGFPSGFVMHPAGGAAPPLKLRFVANSSDLSFTTHMLVSSNVSMLSIPLHVYHGRLVYKVPQALGPVVAVPSSSTNGVTSNGAALDFGTLGVNEARTRSFNVTNPNPIAIDISSITSSLPETNLRLDYVIDANGHSVQLGTNQDSLGAPLSLLQGACTEQNDAGCQVRTGKQPFARIVKAPVMVEGGSGGGLGLDLGPGYTAIFTVELSARDEQMGSGEVVVVTPKERHSIPIRFHSVSGSLSIAPAIVRFDNCYPGLVKSIPLTARSTYSRSLSIAAVTTSDPRLRLVLSNTTVPPDKKVTIGTLEFDAAAGPTGRKDDIQKAFSDQFNLSDAIQLAHIGHLSKTDLQAFKARTDAWKAMVKSSGGEARATVTIHTDVVSGYSLNVRAGLSKPSILVSSSLNFSMVEVGKAALGVIQIFNPTDIPVTAALLEPVAVDAQPPLLDGADGSVIAHRQPAPPYSCKSCSLGRDRPQQYSTGRIPFRFPHGAVLSALIPPRSYVNMGPLEFAPYTHLEPSTALLRIRNNLTFVEELELQGRGGSGSLDFLLDEPDQEGNMRLRVDLDLLGLHRDAMGSIVPLEGVPLQWPVLIHKQFTAINTGNMPVKIHSLWLMPIKKVIVGDSRRYCHLHGFSLSSCGVHGRVTLPPAGHVNVEIKFEPDKSSVLSECLIMAETSIGKLHFGLTADIPLDAMPYIHNTASMGPYAVLLRISAILGSLMLSLIALAAVMYETKDDFRLESMLDSDALGNHSKCPGSTVSPDNQLAETLPNFDDRIQYDKSDGAEAQVSNTSALWTEDISEAADGQKGCASRRRRRRKTPQGDSISGTTEALAVCETEPSEAHADLSVARRLSTDSVLESKEQSEVATADDEAESDVRSDFDFSANASGAEFYGDTSADVAETDMSYMFEPGSVDRSFSMDSRADLTQEPATTDVSLSTEGISETPSSVATPVAVTPEKEARASSGFPSSVVSSRASGPGSKRIAHAALLTPLQTLDHPYLGDIQPAESRQHRTSSGMHRGRPDPSPAKLDACLSSPSASPRDLNATPKSARRRRRPRRGGGGGTSQPVTPGGGNAWSVASTPAECVPEDGSSVWSLPCVSEADHFKAHPMCGPNSIPMQSPWGPSTATNNQGAKRPGAPSGSSWQHNIASTMVPGAFLSPSLPSSHPSHPTAISPAVTGSNDYLAQMGAAAGVPDSVYSIWGGGGLLDAPEAHGGSQLQRSATVTPAQQIPLQAQSALGIGESMSSMGYSGAFATSLAASPLPSALLTPSPSSLSAMSSISLANHLHRQLSLPMTFNDARDDGLMAAAGLLGSSYGSTLLDATDFSAGFPSFSSVRTSQYRTERYEDIARSVTAAVASGAGGISSLWEAPLLESLEDLWDPVNPDDVIR